MSMKSLDLLPALQVLPRDESVERKSFRETMAEILTIDRSMFAAEFTFSTSIGLWALFEGTPLTDGVNVDDSLAEAFSTRWPEMAENQSLHEKWQELVNSGEGIGENEWFFNGLKGQLAEFETTKILATEGYTNISLPDDPNNEGWDISAINPDGQEVLVQVKTGTTLSAGDVQNLMAEDPDYHFALGSEIYEKVIASGIDTGGRIVADAGPDYLLVEGIGDGLETLSGNMGIDIPDGVVDLIPYAPAIVGGVRLIHSFLTTERDFSAADRTTRNQIQVVQTLTLMSRMGVATVLASMGGMVGGTAGTAIPGVGNVVAGVAGTAIGAGAGMYLNKHLRPQMLEIALNLTGLTEDDLFYYKNKQRIDDVGGIFQTRATELTAAPGF